MKIYSNLSLYGNTVDDLVTTRLVVGSVGKNTDGSLKWVTKIGNVDGHFEYYDANTNGGTWIALGSGGSSVSYNGLFNVAPESSATGTSGSSGFTVNVRDASETAGSLKLSATKGILNVGNTSNYFSLDIGSGLVYKKEFTITTTGTQYIRIKNPFESPNVIISIYEITAKSGEPSVYRQILCDVTTGKSNDATPIDIIELTFNGQFENSKYLIVVVGSSTATNIPDYSQSTDVDTSSSSNVKVPTT